MTVKNYPQPSTRRTTLLLCAIAAMQIGCSTAVKSNEINNWIELKFLIDASVEIHLKVPPSKMVNELHEMQFIVTSDNSPTRIFSASYDPGRGRDRDLLLTRISGVMVRTKIYDDEAIDLTLENIKNDLYLSRSDAARRFEIIGEHVSSGRSWLRVNLIGEPYGVSYSSPVSKNTVLILSMSVYGKEADKSRLFKDRHETLKRVVESVRVTSSFE